MSIKNQNIFYEQEIKVELKKRKKKEKNYK